MRLIGLIGMVMILALFWVPVAPAQKVQWSGNGHYYEAISVPSGIFWSDANTAAKASGGHLATITSDAENGFVYSLISGSSFWYTEAQWGDAVGPWLGGYQPAGSPEPAGGWTWVTGEPFSYANWASSEPTVGASTQPDNYNERDNLVMFVGYNGIPAPTWHDVSDNGWNSRGYIIEWDTSQASFQKTELYRWWNLGATDHFYTTDPSGEAAPSSGYTYEGIVGYIATSEQSGTTALYRWWNLGSMDHFYTTDPPGEAAPSSGYTYEGIVGYIATSEQPGTTALYRWWNLGSTDHFYTTDPSGEYAPSNGYSYEGITGYIWTSG